MTIENEHKQSDNKTRPCASTEFGSLLNWPQNDKKKYL